MGGEGSTRWIGHTRKEFVEAQRGIKISDIRAFIDAQKSSRRLPLRRQDDGTLLQYLMVEADSIPHAWRYYFRCQCGRRCRTVYWNGSLYACRTCCRLIHRSTNDDERRWMKRFLKEEGFDTVSVGQFLRSFRRKNSL